MIIVSQNRLTVINFNNVAALDGDVPELPQQLIVASDTGKGQSLGKFKSQERLKEVIAEFIKVYVAGGSVFFVPKE